MFCHQPGTSELFEVVVKIELGQDPKASVVFPDLWPRDDELLPELIKSVLPLETRDPKHYNGQKYIYTLKTRGFAYVILHCEGNSLFALCVVSHYLHPKFFDFLLTTAVSDMEKSESLFKHFYKIEFKESRYDRFIEPDADWQCQVTGGFGEISELQNCYSFLLARYPPYLIGLVLGYIFAGTRVVILSSSLDELSMNVLAFSSLLYPLQKDKFLVQVNTCLTLDELKAADDSIPFGIIGCHMSLIKEVTDKWKAGTVIFNTEVPYLTARDKSEVLPGHVIEAVTAFNSLVVEAINQFKPAFPVVRLFRCVCRLVAQLVAGPYGADAKEWGAVHESYETEKERNFESFKALDKKIAQSKLTEAFFEACEQEEEKPDLILKSYYPEKFNPQGVLCVPRPPLRPDIPVQQKPANKDKRKSEGYVHPVLKK